MAYIVLVLVILLFLMIRRIEHRLNNKLEQLQKILTGLENRFQWLRSKMEDAATAPADSVGSSIRETTSGQPAAPYPPPAGAVGPDDRAALPETVVQAAIPSSPSAASEAPETLEDLELPEEESPVSLPEKSVPTPPVRTPQSTPSPWQERWRYFKANVDWELFTGVKLFAWLGGLALFIAAGFFVKFSIDRNLISPALRLAIGALTGMALIIAAGRFGASRYKVMRHTLSAGGIGVLYSVVFAATLYYEYLPKPLGFGLLALVSAAAFVLAVHYQAVAVSILGAAGAYATPLLVSMGPGRLSLLLAYLVVVNLGLYQVVRRLNSPLLLLTAAAGTLTCLSLVTVALIGTTPAIVVAGSWMANLALFSGFLWRLAADTDQARAFRWSGRLVYAVTLAAAILLMGTHPGWEALLVITGAQAGILGLAWRDPGWCKTVVPFSAMSFLSALVWVLTRFQPAGFSMGFVLLLLYGAAGGVGPLLLIRRCGVNRIVTGWLKVFPVAMAMVGLSVVLGHPVVSFWFWLLFLGLELLGIAISLLLRAFVQIGLLVLMILVGGLHWLFHMPADLVGTGFFIFTMVAGVMLCAAILLVLKMLPRWAAALHLPGAPAGPAPSWAPVLEQWLAAAPAGGICTLLAASFLLPYPMYPHPGLATLTCFLVLVLFAVHRLGAETPGATVLLAAAAAQAIAVLHPPPGLDVAYPNFIWAAGLFAAALATPFLLFRSFERWRRLWYAWAVFEVLQANFVLYTSHVLWPGRGAQWAPLVLAVLKLPAVAVLLRRLAGHPRRNAILAFHGGVLFYYLSAQPVLVLHHGWIGLTFVFEAAALLWLNRRIEHPGLRWVSLGMAPAGLVVLFINLPLLKPAGSLPELNAAVLAVAASFSALAWAAALAGYPGRKLWDLDLPIWFQWLTATTGFYLVNLVIADGFAKAGIGAVPIQTGDPFACLATHTLSGATAAAAGWFAYGLPLLLWRRPLHRSFRLAGLALVVFGTVKALLLPFRFRTAFAVLTPLFNAPSLMFLLFLAGLAWLTLRSWDGRWPLPDVVPRVFWGIVLGLVAFCVLNIEIAGVFAEKGRPFDMLTHGSLAMQLAYSIGWLLFSIGILTVGIRWDTVRVRWAAIAAIVITAVKVFIRDLWHLGQLYRVGSLLGLAVVLILVSFLYQRFLTEGKKNAP
jgi:Predicted membrane protein (DUF2339)